MEGEIKPRGEVMNTARDTTFNKEIIEPRRQLRGLSIQIALKLRPSGLQMIEHCTSRRKRLRMSHESPGKEGYPDLRNRCITIPPCSAIKRIHILRLAREHADRIAAADHFAIRSEATANPKPPLHATRSKPEASNNFVDDKSNLGLLSNLPHGFDERNGLQARVASLYRFNQDRSDVRSIFADVIQRRVGSILKHDHVSCVRQRNSRRKRYCSTWCVANENLIKGAVIITGKVNDAIASRNSTSHAN